MRKVTNPFLVLVLLTSSILPSVANASISGTIFRDHNINSQREAATEPGISGIIVDAYDDTNAVVASSVATDATGTFSIPTGAGNYRLELRGSTIPSYLQPTANTSSGAGSTVQPLTFKASDGDTGILVGLHNPAEYVGTDPNVITNFHVNGVASGNANSVLKLLPQYKTVQENDQTINVTDLATANDLGSTWGLAYDRKNSTVYASAFLRRHVDVGPLGLGGIYKIDISNPASPVISNFTTVTNVGDISAHGGRDLPTDVTLPSHDTVFDEVGRMGLGDLDISDDGSTLYTVNLNTNSLVAVDIANPASQVTTAIGDPFGTCADVRSFAVAIKDNVVHVGSVCTTDITLGAAISVLNGGAFTTLHTMPLNFRGETSYSWRSPANDRWSNWLTDPLANFDPYEEIAQPLLSDIVFKEDGSMILGFGDRTGYQMGRENHGSDPNDNNLYNGVVSGDMNLVCYVGGAYYNEGHANCPYNSDTHQAEDTEFFLDDQWFNSAGATSPNHEETFLGGVAYGFGSNLAISSSFDAVERGDYYVSGLSWNNTQDGLRKGAKNLAGSTNNPQSRTYMAKAGGIGDVELLAESSPIEIGNYVWDDTTPNGIQDPSENGLPNVVVRLYEGGVEIGNDTTDANGHYYFGGLLQTNLTTPLKYDTDYEIRIDLADANLGTRIPTTQNAGLVMQRDSDGDNGVLNAGFSTIAYRTGGVGENDHQQDFGFRNAAACSLTASAVPSACTNVGNDADGTNDTFNLAVTVEGSNTGASTTYTYTSSSANISGGGTYSATAETDGAFVISATTSPFDLVITDSADNACTTTVSNLSAPATCSTSVLPRVPPPTGPTAFSCSSDVRLATVMQINGDSQVGGSTGAGENSLITFDYAATGTLAAPEAAITAGQIGSVWGLGYNETNQQMYASAFLKRHSSFGPNGPGAIYQLDTSSATPSASLLIDLASAGVTVGTDPRVASSGSVDDPNELPIDATHPSWDRDAFDLVGKMSLGDIDVSTDGNTLWAVSLNQRELVEIDISGAPVVTASHAIPDPGCSNAEYRPWAAKVHDGKVWVGIVCSAETSQDVNDLRAYVTAFDGTSFLPVYDFPLNYVKGSVMGSDGIAWYPWTSTYQTVASDPQFTMYPQPILSDIEFDMDGSMILGFLDRSGHQMGGSNYPPDNFPTTSTFVQGMSGGDILRVCNNAGTYELENNGACGGTSTLGVGNGEGPGGGEYYWGEMWQYNGFTASDGFHEETSFGGLAFRAGSGEVALSSMNPLQPNANAGGIIWLDTTTGARPANEGVQLYRGNGQHFGKSSGLGDVELFCRSAPTCSLNAPTVTAQCNNAGTPNDPSDDTFTYTINTTGTGVGASYSISGDDTQSGVTYSTNYTSPASFPIAGGDISLTLTDVDTASCTLTPVAVTAPATCSSATPQVDIALVKTANPTTAMSGDTVTYTLVASNNGPDDATGVVVSDPLPAGLTYSSDDGGADTTEAGGTVTWTIGNLAASASATLNITVTVD